MRCWGGKGEGGGREGNHLQCFWYPELGGSLLCTMSSWSWEKEACRRKLYFWWGTEKVQLIHQLWCPQQDKHQGAGECREMTDFKLNFSRAADGTAKTGLRALPHYKQGLLQ